MKVLLAFDYETGKENEKILSFLNSKCNTLKFDLAPIKINTGAYRFEDYSVAKLAEKIKEQLSSIIGDYDKILCFVNGLHYMNYSDMNNFIFFFGMYDLLPSSIIPKSNFILYLTLQYIAYTVDKTGFEHIEKSGCIYDERRHGFNTREGLRFVKVCSTCIERINRQVLAKNEIGMVSDLIILSNELTNSSKWYHDILTPMTEINSIDTRDENFDWDAFISHASEDKEEVAIPLFELLTNKGMKIWLDKHELSLGNSLRRKIDEGLSNSRFGIVILSERFFQKEWTRKELDALVSREDGKEEVILPIWHKVDKSFIMKHSPLLSDKVAISSNEGLEKVANKIYKVYKKNLNNRVQFFSELEVNYLIEAVKFHSIGSVKKIINKDGTIMSQQHPFERAIEKLKKREEISLKSLNYKELFTLVTSIETYIQHINQYYNSKFFPEQNKKRTAHETLSKLKIKLLKVM